MGGLCLISVHNSCFRRQKGLWPYEEGWSTLYNSIQWNTREVSLGVSQNPQVPYYLKMQGKQEIDEYSRGGGGWHSQVLILRWTRISMICEHWFGRWRATMHCGIKLMRYRSGWNWETHMHLPIPHHRYRKFSCPKWRIGNHGSEQSEVRSVQDSDEDGSNRPWKRAVDCTRRETMTQFQVMQSILVRFEHLS